jgi:predicted branched-subunit amino acid permease
MDSRNGLIRGIRAGLPLAPPTLALGVSFGVLAEPVMGKVAPIVMSVAIFSGAAQFASLTVLAAGGGVLAAVAAAVLVSARWLVMGFAVGPSLPGGLIARALQGQAVVDASFAIASRGDGSFDRELLIGATIPQAASWIAGTVVGVVVGPVLGDPRHLGLDAVFVAFYLALLWRELGGHKTVAAAAGAGIALALMPIAPVGVPIVAASLAALIGLRAK